MSQELYLPEGSILTVTAVEAVVARQIQDASITASLPDGSSHTFGPYPLGRDFLIGGNASVAIAEASGAEFEATLKSLAFSDFANDPTTTTGLTYGIKPGRVLFDFNSDFTTYEAATATLFDNTLNYIYLCPDLDQGSQYVVWDTNTPPPFLPVGNYLIGRITTAGGAITEIVDNRALVFTSFQAQGLISDLGFVKLDIDDPFTITLKPGNVMTRNGPVYILSGRIVQNIPDDATSYIEVSPTGVVSHNTSGFTAGYMPLYEVQMASGAIYSMTDHRCFMSIFSGATGSFTSNDAKTVTVTNGIITAIA